MHLAELLARRPVPAAAIFLALTRRCPLHCRHCSTMSGADSREHQGAASLRRFVASFTAADHPEFLLLTGGEPLLRPRLVRDLAQTARVAGTHSYLLTGAFFARTGKTPGPIRAALESVDHVAVSVDVFHEREVPRPEVFRVLHEIQAAGRDVSIQACGSGPGDPYLAALAQQVRAEFGDGVPLLVTTLRPVGRARSWLAGPVPGPEDRTEPSSYVPPALPCDMAAWPTVGFDGTITACCNSDVLESRPVPAHLWLGHVSTATWPEVRDRCVCSPVLRGIRTQGPVRLGYQFGEGAAPPAAGGYCGTCRSLADPPRTLRQIEAHQAGPRGVLMEQMAIAMQARAGAAGFARRHGDPGYASLTLLGRSS